MSYGDGQFLYRLDRQLRVKHFMLGCGELRYIKFNIKFTHDLEKDGKLNFLDVTINHFDNQFSTSVYRKPTFTGLGLRFDSFTPRSFKINLISCLIHRAYKISSSYRLFHLDLSYLHKYFSGNLYPQYLFDLFLFETTLIKCLTLNCLSNLYKNCPSP